MNNQQTMEIAKQAIKIAQQASNNIATHEAVCAERYRGINEKLQNLPHITQSITQLNKTISKAIGGIMAFSTLATIISIVVAVLKVVG